MFLPRPLIEMLNSLGWRPVLWYPISSTPVLRPQSHSAMATHQPALNPHNLRRAAELLCCRTETLGCRHQESSVCLLTVKSHWWGQSFLREMPVREVRKPQVSVVSFCIWERVVGRNWRKWGQMSARKREPLCIFSYFQENKLLLLCSGFLHLYAKKIKKDWLLPKSLYKVIYIIYSYSIYIMYFWHY